METALRCPHCGAPVNAEVCGYCGSRINFDISQTELEGSLLKAKNVTGYGTLKSLLIFGIFWEAISVIGGVLFTLLNDMENGMDPDTYLLFAILIYGLFNVVGVGCILSATICTSIFNKIKKDGDVVEGVCIGYIKDEVKIKLQINGKTQILFLDHDNQKDYITGSKIKFRFLNNKFIVEE